jgi:hypothetical protein
MSRNGLRSASRGGARGRPPCRGRPRLAADAEVVLAQGDVKERMLAVGVDPPPAPSSAAFADRFKAGVGPWAKVIRDANIKAE